MINFLYLIIGSHLHMLSMATGNSYIDDLRSKPEVIDLPENEQIIDVGEHVSDTAQSPLKPNVTVSSSVRDLLECPVCLNAMYPPIYQVQQYYLEWPSIGT